MNKLLRSTLLSVSLAAAAPLVLAQAQATNPQANAPRNFQPHSQHSQRDGKRPFSLPSERVEARLAYLRTALKITEAQRPQWDAFADVQRRQAKQGDERMQSWRARMAQQPGDARPGAFERLEFRQKMLAARSQQLGELIAAGKPLYAALTPEQKQVADQLIGAGGRHGGSHHRGMRGHA